MVLENGGDIARKAAGAQRMEAAEDAKGTKDAKGAEGAKGALRPDTQGKVRDLYDLGDELLIVASDRISAFDYILPDEIACKGEVLTQLSLFWLDFFKDRIDNHLIGADVADLPERFAPYADYLAGRFMLVKKAQMFPVECIVRGYLAGSGLASYERDGTVCGIELPDGLVEASELPEPIFTPSTKAAVGGHDENISFARLEDLVGEDDARLLRDTSIGLYRAAAAYAEERGIIVADTKFEFGLVDGRLVLADEVLTCDSSRFWPTQGYEPGRAQPSFDKQYVRDWLSGAWDRTGEPPRMPEEVKRASTEKYLQAYEMLTGRPFTAQSRV